MEKSGLLLFRYRGQLPLLIFLFVALVIPFTDYQNHSSCLRMAFHWGSALLVFLGMSVRFYTVGTAAPGTSGRNRDEQVAERLNTTGIYSVVRHPLYLGNYLVWLGLVVFTESVVFMLLFSLIYWVYYERIMLAEEAFIANKFGQAFNEWSSEVPAFLPRLKGFIPPVVPFSFKPGLRGEYSGVISIALSYLYMEVLIGWVRYGKIVVGDRLLIACVVCIVISLVLRTLKHHSRFLDRAYPENV
ncbi:MAG: methyltransferase family protein [Bacteroidota bacterium]